MTARAGREVSCPSRRRTRTYSLNGGDSFGEALEVLRVAIDNPAAPPGGLPWPFAGGSPSPDRGYYDLAYTLAGSERTGIWLINGEQFPNVTVEEIARGSSAVIEVRTLSPTEHPFHLHGLAFEVLALNGVPPAHKTVEGTLNLKIREREAARRGGQPRRLDGALSHPPPRARRHDDRAACQVNPDQRPPVPTTRDPPPVRPMRRRARRC